MQNSSALIVDKIIHRSLKLNCDAHQAFEMFTVNEKLQSWLTELADVEPRVGGKYELFWNPEDKQYDSTIGCKITAIKEDRFLSFEWKGPKQYNDFMNTADPLTHVVVFFIPGDGFTEVQLIHSGWRSSPEWEEARQWFDKMWGWAFAELEKRINQ